LDAISRTSSFGRLAKFPGLLELDMIKAIYWEIVLQNRGLENCWLFKLDAFENENGVFPEVIPLLYLMSQS
jgi:hypothetical protein